MMKHPPDPHAAQSAIAAFLEALGYDAERPELAGTPARVVEAYLKDLVAGEWVDVERLIEQGSVSSLSAGLVVVRDITTMTMCPHHLLPARGQATVAYLPGSRIMGLGTVARIVDVYSRRLTLQEQIGGAVTNALMKYAGARGAYCALRFDHACLRLRGARQSDAIVDTIHIDGELREGPFAEQLALALGTDRNESQKRP
jgi:GTP cyclohydrolase IA